MVIQGKGVCYVVLDEKSGSFGCRDGDDVFLATRLGRWDGGHHEGVGLGGFDGDFDGTALLCRSGLSQVV